MTYCTDIRRHYRSRAEAYAYLASRGFLFLPNGWANGRWAATVEIAHGEFIVRVWLQGKAVA